MAALATAAELGGAVLLLLGLGVRLIAVPLMVTMLVAAFAVHWREVGRPLAQSESVIWTDNDR